MMMANKWKNSLLPPEDDDESDRVGDVSEPKMRTFDDAGAEVDFSLDTEKSSGLTHHRNTFREFCACG